MAVGAVDGGDLAAVAHGDAVARELAHEVGEDDLAERALSLTDDELTRIRTLGAYYPWSEQALAFRGSMGGARALTLATIDVIEGTQRDLRWHHTKAELEFGRAKEPDAVEVARDHWLRLHAAEDQ